MKAPIEIWFDFASNYSYLSVMRIEEAARQAGRQVQWRPFLLGPIFQAQGWNNSPFVLQKAKGIYVWQDMLRQCRKHGLPWQKPSVFPRVSLLASRVALYGAGQAWIGAFCRQVMTLNFAEDRDITDPQLINEVLGGPRPGCSSHHRRGALGTEQAGPAHADRTSHGPRHVRRADILRGRRDVLGR